MDSESATLWHSLRNPSMDADAWARSIKRDGIIPEGGDYLREHCVFMHKPEESPYREELLDAPTVRIEAPPGIVYGVELSEELKHNGTYKNTHWKHHLEQYDTFDPDPDRPAEYVVIGPVLPEYVRTYHDKGVPERYRPEPDRSAVTDHAETLCTLLEE